MFWKGNISENKSIGKYGFPTASVIFFSIVLRIVFAALLIYWQDRQEREGKEFSLKNILLLRRK